MEKIIGGSIAVGFWLMIAALGFSGIFAASYRLATRIIERKGRR